MLDVSDICRNSDVPVLSLCGDGKLPRDASSGLSVDWSGAAFVPISLICAIAAVQLRGKETYSDQLIVKPRRDVCSYLSRVDYFDVVGVPFTEAFTRHQAGGRFLELSKVPISEHDSDINSVAEALASVVLSHVELHTSVKDYINYSFGEMLDNIVQHSAAQSPGLVAAQYYKYKGYLEICIADTGIGIVASMRENPGYESMTDEELLRKAFERDTGQWYGRSKFGTGKVSRGMGLYVTANVARAVGGDIWCVSRNQALHISSAQTSPLHGLYYPGTVIVMRVHDTGKVLHESDVWPDGGDGIARWSVTEGGAYTEEEGILW